MFAVVRTGGKQYRVAAGDKIVVDRIDGEAGARVSLGDAIFASNGGSGVAVAAEIIAQAKADKVIVFKKKRRHNYRRKAGHRQQHTILRILSVGDEQAPERTRQHATPTTAVETAPVDAAPVVVESTPVVAVAQPVVEAPVKKSAKKAAAPAIESVETAAEVAPAVSASSDTDAVRAEPIKKGATKKAPAKPAAPQE